MRKSTFFMINLFVLMSMLLARLQRPHNRYPRDHHPDRKVSGKDSPGRPDPGRSSHPGEPAVVSYARNETLYTSGTQWGPPSSWNPLNGGGYAMGTIGLVYETLYIYDPLADKFTPWLAAEDMNWADDTTLEIKLRDGITWQDGTPLTADDVKFTFDTGRSQRQNQSRFELTPACGISCNRSRRSTT